MAAAGSSDLALPAASDETDKSQEREERKRKTSKDDDDDGDGDGDDEGSGGETTLLKKKKKILCPNCDTRVPEPGCHGRCKRCLDAVNWVGSLLCNTFQTVMFDRTREDDDDDDDDEKDEDRNETNNNNNGLMSA